MGTDERDGISGCKCVKGQHMQHDFILLDRSGSMQVLWTEALNSVNAYVKKLADDKVDTGVTLATFDKDGEQFMFEVIRDRITPSTWKPVSAHDAAPRGMTPLNDAIGRIVALAKAGVNGTEYDKLVLIVMTDGLENASREYTQAAAKALLDDCRAKYWQVIFLGADFDNAAQASSYGNMAAATLAASEKNLQEAMIETASLRARHALADEPMRYSDEQKRRLRQ
jgi:von Willebrand factor type A domain